jgi:hypothetical protein
VPGATHCRHFGASSSKDEGMAFVIVLAALCFLMLVAYRGYSVIVFAPVAALGAVLLTDPRWSRRCSPACSWTRWSASSSCTSRCSCSARCSAS